MKRNFDRREFLAASAAASAAVVLPSVATAQALQSAVRGDDSVGRFGGDEFLVLARVPDRAAASTVAQQLIGAIRASAAGQTVLAQVTASVGYALAPEDADSVLKLVQRADDAMYFAKRSGKNRAAHCSAAPL